MQVNQRESPLLRLSGEIRNRIYDFVVTDGTVHIFPPKSTESASNCIGVIQTCRQVRYECSTLVFTKATFNIQRPLVSSDLAKNGYRKRYRSFQSGEMCTHYFDRDWESRAPPWIHAL
jgi:hypothetical protein